MNFELILKKSNSITRKKLSMSFPKIFKMVPLKSAETFLQWTHVQIEIHSFLDFNLRVMLQWEHFFNYALTSTLLTFLKYLQIFCL